MSAEEQIYREFLETYNRIVEECFNRCIYSFNYRYLLDDEVMRENHSSCASRCASSYVNFNQRVAMNFAQIQSKKMISAMEQEENQTPTNDTNNVQTLQDSRPS